MEPSQGSRPAEAFDEARKLVESAIVHSPFARHLGVACEEIAPDRVRLRLPFARELATIGDLVHGGAIASLCDVAATGACWANAAIAPGSRGTTIGLSLSFLAGARGHDLVAEARVVQRGRSVCVAEVEVRAGGALVARATATYKLDAPRVASPPADPAAAMAALFAGRAPAEQRALLARLERAGAGLYRAMADSATDADQRRSLLEAAAREEQNAALLEGSERGGGS
ncbi:MAG TPA: PaaI family thioesterase [Myxococcota bacterium]|jgi:uncharacterized protein (TIGR00369 family)|nr:PaaI family thioesterase [Myxococcota bacterium]